MKNILTIVVLLIATLAISSCDSNTPSGVVEKAFNCERDGDMQNYWELMSTSDNFKVDESNRKYYYKESNDNIKRIMQNYCKKIYDFEIVSEEIDENDSNKAIVKIKYKIRDEERKRIVHVKKCEDGKWRVVRHYSGASAIFL